MLPIFLALAYNNEHVSEVLRVRISSFTSKQHELKLGVFGIWYGVFGNHHHHHCQHRQHQHRHHQHHHHHQVGWTPVLMAMLIASGGGFVLEMAVEHFKGVTLFGQQH